MKLNTPHINTEDTELRLSNLPRAWREFIQYCQSLQFGELIRVKIQNGLPVLVEEATKKVKFGS